MAVMQQLRGSRINLAAANPILAAGQIGFETDTNRFKIGDGVTEWIDLIYANCGNCERDGVSGLEIADVTGVAAKASNGKVSLKWTDPDDVKLNGVTLVRWAGTLIVRKEGSIPENKNDGTVVVDSTTRNAYATTSYEDTGLTNGKIYYYRFFPYTKLGTYIAGSSAKAIPNLEPATISLSENNIELDNDNLIKTVTINTNSDGAISIVSSDVNEDFVRVSFANNTITLTAVYNGHATLTISQEDGTNYLAPNDITLSVNIGVFPPDIIDAPPALIQEALNQGKASTLWDVGDKVGIELNGTVGNLTFDHETWYASILGFDHMKDVETEGKNSISFIFGKNENDVDIAFCDFDGAYAAPNTSAFRHAIPYNNFGGWLSASYIRNTIIPQFISAMPVEWQNVLADITKYTDNAGGGRNNETCVSASVEKVFLLAGYEITADSSKLNPFETYRTGYKPNGQTYGIPIQAQYDYYKNGNGFRRYNHRNGVTAVHWWTRSPFRDDKISWVNIDANQSSNIPPKTRSDYGEGFAPAFALVADS